MLFFACLLGWGGCAPSSESDKEAIPAAWIRVDLDKSEPERLLRYYFGGYAASGGADPFKAGLVVEQDRRLYIDLDALEAAAPGTRAYLDDVDDNNRIDWEELARFIQSTYYKTRGLPTHLSELQEKVPYRDEDWYTVEVDGVMTQARRRVYVSRAALHSALEQYWRHEEKLIYPVGTAIVGEHVFEGGLAETTLMQKREDGFWDFAVYDATGRLAESTTTPPRPLKAPTQCVGCHFGTKLFEPAKSFPAEAPPSPHGPSRLYVDERVRDAEVVAFFKEHSKRSDTVLGLYNTLLISQLRADQRDGLLAEKDAQLLTKLGL